MTFLLPVISEDEDEDDELRAVQTELEELQARKEELQRSGVTFTAGAQGGRFPLPPPAVCTATHTPDL